MDKSIYTHEYAVLLRLLRAHREKHGFTQKEMAAKLGVTQSTYSKLERGDRRIDVIQLRTITISIGIDFLKFAQELEQEIRKGEKPSKRSTR
ncbi:MAG: helix-turn-helix transcriptional regulator [Rubripirellula sp.]